MTQQHSLGHRPYWLCFLFPLLFSTAQAQTCQSGIIATTPTADFTVHDNGTVTHTKTGLMWKVCSEGQTWDNGACSGTAATHTWQQALQIPQALNTGGGYAGHSDWRLPNLKELQSIVELKCYDPAINETVFNNTLSSYYWSSSPYASGSDYAWGVYFNYGHDGSYNRVNHFRARLVRGGQ